MPRTCDAAGLHRHFLACHGQLREVAASILGCRQRAEDVVQDTWFKLADLPSQHQQQVRQPRAFLMRLVRNLAIDRYRRLAMESTLFAAPEEALELSCSSATPEHRLISRQALAQVAEALATLPERTRHAFLLHRLDGYTQREVAEQLGVSVTLVNFMIRDAQQCCRPQPG